MSSAIDSSGFLEFAPDDGMHRRLTDLGIAWDVCEVKLRDIDMADNQFQTRTDVGSADQEFVLRYSQAYIHGDRLPMPLVVVPYSMRLAGGTKAKPCAGRHRLEGAVHAGALRANVIRALPSNQNEVDALRDISAFDNAANGKSISSEDIYGYCASEIIRKNGGHSEGMPDARFISRMYRRWQGQSVVRDRVVLHVKAQLAKHRCASLGVATPAGYTEPFAKLWHWESDSGFDHLARTFCACVADDDVRRILSESKRKRRSAAATLSEMTQAARGYRAKGTPMDSVAVCRVRCNDIRKALRKMDSDMSIDLAKLDEVEELIRSLSADARKHLAALRSRVGGLCHA